MIALHRATAPEGPADYAGKLAQLLMSRNQRS